MRCAPPRMARRFAGAPAVLAGLVTSASPALRFLAVGATEAPVPPLTEVSMSHQLKLCTWRELKEVYGIPYCRMHIRRLELKGRFPQRVQVGDCRVPWLAHQVEQS